MQNFFSLVEGEFATPVEEEGRYGSSNSLSRHGQGSTDGENSVRTNTKDKLLTMLIENNQVVSNLATELDSLKLKKCECENKLIQELKRENQELKLDNSKLRRKLVQITTEMEEKTKQIEDKKSENKKLQQSIKEFKITIDGKHIAT